MKMLNKIREFFWPLLEKGETQKIEELSIDVLNINEENLEKALEFTIKTYEEEESRKSSIESKSSLFIGTISVVTSVIIGITSFLIKTTEFSTLICLLVFVLFILTLYMARTVWFSIKALERQAYHTVNKNDFLIAGNKISYYKKIIIEIINKTLKNSVTINSKVDNMTMAQEYFKRAIVVITLYSFFLFIYFLSELPSTFKLFSNKTIDLLNLIDLGSWIIVSLCLVIFISIVTNFILFKKLKRK